MQLRGQNLPALAAFDLMTRGNSAALGLETEIGTIAPGAFADLVVSIPRHPRHGAPHGSGARSRR